MRIKRRQFLQVAAASGGAALLSPPKAIAEQQFLTSAPLGSFKMFYEVHGDGPAVVFAHGSGGTHMSCVFGLRISETFVQRQSQSGVRAPRT